MVKDFLDEIMEERTRANPEFPRMVEAAERSRQLLRTLAEQRVKLQLSQTEVAARMGTSQSALARLEGGDSDPRLSTVERYALAIGEALGLAGGGDRVFVAAQTVRLGRVRVAGASAVKRGSRKAATKATRSTVAGRPKVVRRATAAKGARKSKVPA